LLDLSWTGRISLLQWRCAVSEYVDFNNSLMWRCWDTAVVSRRCHSSKIHASEGKKHHAEIKNFKGRKKVPRSQWKYLELVQTKPGERSIAKVHCLEGLRLFEMGTRWHKLGNTDGPWWTMVDYMASYPRKCVHTLMFW
jgi:hypothetical protein